MNILISPNAFKNSVDAKSVALLIQEGLILSKLDCTCECYPIADGGDGTCDLIMDKLSGKYVESIVRNPLGKKTKATFGLINMGNTAVIEMSNASGMKLLKPDELNPLIANSFGTGEQMILALDKGVKKIIIGMGGSATVDGGTGILSALGVRFLNKSGENLHNLPKDLPDLDCIDISGLDKRILDCELVVLCDVDNKLLGEYGSAKVFGPQKGATPNNVKKLDDCLLQLSKVIIKNFGLDISEIKFGGTAGGAAAGLYALLNAKLVNGIDYFLELTGYDGALEKCDLVITGEGSIDEQTLQGKGPFGVAKRAKSRGIPVIGLAGKVPLQITEELHQYFDVLIPISHEPLDLAKAFDFATHNIKRTAFEIGNLLNINN
ncbi:glycerate kinase [Confluentibacter flavum]|uniref:Glycerate kinase n=1 Tax=Confluentibacter flavum TaxID=1909700 RepID=A0A2N3HK68_9FLAO|nr:glycerate kinase [Confluentibacter flavum]PKQ45379.1 glycerate kinase [Confluentibacter flavum]